MCCGDLKKKRFTVLEIASDRSESNCRHALRVVPRWCGSNVRTHFDELNLFFYFFFLSSVFELRIIRHGPNSSAALDTIRKQIRSRFYLRSQLCYLVDKVFHFDGPARKVSERFTQFPWMSPIDCFRALQTVSVFVQRLLVIGVCNMRRLCWQFWIRASTTMMACFWLCSVGIRWRPPCSRRYSRRSINRARHVALRLNQQVVEVTSRFLYS